VVNEEIRTPNQGLNSNLSYVYAGFNVYDNFLCDTDDTFYKKKPQTKLSNDTQCSRYV